MGKTIGPTVHLIVCDACRKAKRPDEIEPVSPRYGTIIQICKNYRECFWRDSPVEGY